MPRYDTHLQLIDPTAQRASSIFTYEFEGTRRIDGIQKLVNRWLKCFFTPRGSHPLRPTEGTDFPYLVGGNNITDVPSLEATVVLYMEDASDQIKAIDRRSSWLSTEERLRSVSLLRFVQTAPDAIEFWVQVTNVAGRRLNQLIPYAAG